MHGDIATVKNPRSDPAQPTPRLVYNAAENKGKPAAKHARVKEFAASALAAYNGCASTRKVKTEENTRRVPVAKKPEPMIGTIGWIDGSAAVHANQKMPSGTRIPPRIPGGSRSSGAIGCRRVWIRYDRRRVQRGSVRVPMIMPISIPRKVSPVV